MTSILHCASGMDCFNTPGSFTCGCAPGYVSQGPSSCVDENECLSGNNNCGEGPVKIFNYRSCN